MGSFKMDRRQYMVKMNINHKVAKYGKNEYKS